MLKRILHNPVLLLKSIASVMYIVMGILILVKPTLLAFLNSTWIIVLGVILIVYGIFRGSRVIAELKNGKY